MTADEKLTAILAAVQTDPGHRGLGRVPGDNLFTACPGDFAAACRSIMDGRESTCYLCTGFYIPTAAAYETDGPLGTVFLARGLAAVGIPSIPAGGIEVVRSMHAGLAAAGLDSDDFCQRRGVTHIVAIERAGASADGRCYTMRGQDISPRMSESQAAWDAYADDGLPSVGIGDGGNEIGMGKIPHETVVANIPNGDLIHCRVPTDFLIVAGVSNWGAYALAAGVYVLRGNKPPADLFDPDRERAILEVMVRDGPLVDGVTGKPTATVDGLTWDEYAQPLIRIREILAS